MSGPHNIVLGSGVTPLPVPTADDTTMGDADRWAVEEAGFDPQHVQHQFVQVGYRDENGRPTSAMFDLFVARDAAGRQALEEAGYYQIERSRGDRVIAGYLSPEQFAEYASQQLPSETAACDAYHRLSGLSGSRGQVRLRDANAAITSAWLMTPPRPDPKHPGQTIESTFDAKTIDPDARESVRQDAEAVLRAQGLVPHTVGGGETVYWMTEIQWAAYDRVAEASGVPGIDQD